MRSSRYTTASDAELFTIRLGIAKTTSMAIEHIILITDPGVSHIVMDQLVKGLLSLVRAVPEVDPIAMVLRKE